MSDASGDHMVETYSSMGLVMAIVVSCCFPHVVNVSVLSIRIVLRDLLCVAILLDLMLIECMLCIFLLKYLKHIAIK